jgi:hypothetical protein
LIFKVVPGSAALPENFSEMQSLGPTVRFRNLGVGDLPSVINKSYRRLDVLSGLRTTVLYAPNKAKEGPPKTGSIVINVTEMALTNTHTMVHGRYSIV